MRRTLFLVLVAVALLSAGGCSNLKRLEVSFSATSGPSIIFEARVEGQTNGFGQVSENFTR